MDSPPPPSLYQLCGGCERMCETAAVSRDNGQSSQQHQVFTPLPTVSGTYLQYSTAGVYISEGGLLYLITFAFPV